MFKKNDEVEVVIEDMSTEGQGVGKIDGYTLFIKDAVIGDTVLAGITRPKKNYAFARLIKVIQPSEHRTTPKCSVAKQCGGCQLQCMNYEAQLEFKYNKVLNNLKRIGGVGNVNLKPIMGMEEPFNYRNKAQFPVGTDKNGNITYGFYAGRTHSIINSDDCALGLKPNGRDVNSEVMLIVKNHMEKYGITAYDEQTGAGTVRHVLIRIGAFTGQIMVCIVINSDSFKNADVLVEELQKIPGMTDICLNVNKSKNNVILGQKVISLYGPGYIEDSIGDVKFKISPLSFFQVNPLQTVRLYEKALEYAGLTGKEMVWDLYCGIGSISLFLARKARKVLGVEIVAPAVENARENAKYNGISNAEFMVGEAEEVVPKYYEEHRDSAECKPDVVVVDPPRKGCDSKLLDTIVNMNPKKIVYVSCDSATLARDVKILAEAGYSLTEATPVDMFPQTVHVETVCLLYKENM